MQRKFLINLGFLLFLNFLIKPIWIFGIDRTVQNTVGVGEYGFYFVIFNFTLIFNILLDLGITNFNNRNIAQSNHLLNKHFSGILVLKILLGFVYLMIIFLVALLVGYNEIQLKLLGILGLNQFLLSLILYLRSNISGLLYFKTDSILSVLDRFLMIIFCGILLWGNVVKGAFRIEWFVYSQTLAYLITVIIALVLVVIKAKFRSLNWNWPFFLVILKRSYPFALLVLLMACYTWVNPVILETILKEPYGNDEAGIYASGYRLLDAASMISFLFAGLLMPIFSKMIKKNESINQILRLSFSLIITLAIIIVSASIFYAYEIIALLYDSHVEASTSVFRFLIIGFAGVSTSYIFGTLLTANGNLRQLNIIAAVAVGINIVFNLLLVPKLLSTGSAISSLITQSFVAITQVILVQRIFKIKIKVRYLFSLLLFTSTVLLMNYLSHQWTFSLPGIELHLVWIVKLCIVCAIAVLFSFGLKLVSPKSIVSIIRKET